VGLKGMTKKIKDLLKTLRGEGFPKNRRFENSGSGLSHFLRKILL
jgi:hypothetical protein